MFLNALVKMTASVTDVFCITQITYIVINNALLIDQRWFWLFTMEIASNGKLPFVGIEICKKGCKLVTSVYRKPTNTGLLLHHQSHVDNRYKRSLVKTMLNRAYRLSSTWELFSTECERLKLIFSNLKYSDSLVNSTITCFVNSVISPDTRSTPPTENIYHIVLPFKDQKSADIVKKHLSDLSYKLDHKLQPVFRSRKIGNDLKVQEPKPPLINQQCVVYNYICDLCDAEYVGYTSRHLYKRIEEHRFTAIGKHLQNEHRVDTVGDLTNNFKILKKCQGKFHCLIHEMLWIRKKKPSLNTQSDSIRAKVFV